MMMLAMVIVVSNKSPDFIRLSSVSSLQNLQIHPVQQARTPNRKLTILQFTGSQRAGQDLATEQQQQYFGNKQP